jgi:hypothetical protein
VNAPLRVRAGLRFITMLGEVDTDDDGNDRITEPGAVGTISHKSSLEGWCLVFPSGAAVNPTTAELRDPKHYTLLAD